MERGLFVLGLLVALHVAAPAQASQQEIYLVSGGGYFSSAARLLAGYGGGPGYRYHFSESVAVHVELRWLGFLGNAWSTSAGGTYTWSLGRWHPAAGLQVTGFVGDQVRVVSSHDPDPVVPFAISVQARFAPLRFKKGSACASALGVDVGAGIDRGHGAVSLLFSLLEIGYRF